MSLESYLNHPMFGLLLMVCPLDERRELFTTLYAQRLFFLVSNGEKGMMFEPVTRSDARSLVEGRMRTLHRSGQMGQYKTVQTAYKRTFQF